MLRRGFNEDLAYITNYKPNGLSRINILLCGGVGAGKSTIVNSFLTAFDDEVARVARSAVGESSVTRLVTSYPVATVSKEMLTTRITLWDTPGFTYEGTVTTYRHGQLSHILSGVVPHGFANVDTARIVPHETRGVRAQPSPADKMHVVMLCIHFKHLAERGSSYMARISEFIEIITNPDSPWTQSKCRVPMAKAGEALASNFLSLFSLSPNSPAAHHPGHPCGRAR